MLFIEFGSGRSSAPSAKLILIGLAVVTMKENFHDPFVSGTAWPQLCGIVDYYKNDRDATLVGEDSLSLYGVKAFEVWCIKEEGNR